MATITRLTRLVNGIHRELDLTANTLVLENVRINLGGSNIFTFAGTLTADRTITVPDSNLNLGHITSLTTLSGVSGGSTDLGTFTGSTIPDGSTIKAALQSLETAVESVSTNPDFADNVFRISDDGDNTKKIAFQASGIATGTTRTITMPDANVDLGKVDTAIQRDGSVAFTANQSMGSNRITNVSDPVGAQDAATKAYVDNLIDGRSWKQSVKAATTTNGNLSSDFENGDVIDGVTLATGDRILIKDQTTASENGIYVVQASGAPVRSSDADAPAELIAAAVFVEEGTVNGDKQFAQTGDGNTFAANSVWVVTSANAFSGHDMISLSGGQISVDLATDAGLESTNPGNAAGQLRVKLDGTSLSRSTAGLKVADGGITGTQLAASVAGAGLVGGAGSPLDVNPGDGIEIVSDQVRVKSSDIVGEGLEEDGSNNLRVKLDGNSLSRSSAGVKVEHSPVLRRVMVAGESFAANTSFLVRMARDTETAGRVYKADRDATTNNNFYVIGIALSTTAVAAGDDIPVIMMGTHVLGSGDTAFASADVGKPVFLDASGAFTVTAPTTTNHAVVRAGIVENTDRIFVQPQLVGIN